VHKNHVFILAGTEKVQSGTREGVVKIKLKRQGPENLTENLQDEYEKLTD
jgi:hypothetical protein